MIGFEDIVAKVVGLQLEQIVDGRECSFGIALVRTGKSKLEPGSGVGLGKIHDLLEQSARLERIAALQHAYRLLDRNPQSVRAGPSPAPAETTTSAPPEPPGAPDAAAASGAPANFNQEDLFGKSGNEMERTVQQATGSERLDSLSATVTKLEHYACDKVLVALDNGQVCKQVDSSSLRLRVGDEIDIERASLGSFMLRKQGSKRSMRVSRKD